MTRAFSSAGIKQSILHLDLSGYEWTAESITAPEPPSQTAFVQACFTVPCMPLPPPWPTVLTSIILTYPTRAWAMGA